MDSIASEREGAQRVLIEFDDQLLESAVRERAAYLEKLEAAVPSDSRLVTAQDILDLHLVNALLAEQLHYRSPDQLQNDTDIQLLEARRDELCKKIIKISALAILDPEKSGRIPHLQEVVDRYRDEYVAFAESRKGKTEIDTMREFVLDLIRHDRASPRDISRLLQDMGESFYVLALKDVTKIAREAVNASDAKKVALVEELLATLHMSGPWLDYICDRVWEVANVLDGVFADTLHAVSTRPSSDVISVAKHFPSSTVRGSYFAPREVTLDDMKRMAAVAAKKDERKSKVRYGDKFQYALLLERKIPIHLLMALPDLPINFGTSPSFEELYLETKQSMSGIYDIFAFKEFRLKTV